MLTSCPRPSATLFGASAALAITLMCPSIASAEIELSLYGGTQSAVASDVTGTRADTTAFSSRIHWEGKSFAMPPYYGARATWWQQSDIGWGVEMTHDKVYSPAGDRPAGFTHLEFTDGHNIVTANVLKRWPGLWGNLTPYAGAGVGFAVPHVETTENGNVTSGYQVTGPAVRVMAGVKYSLNDHWGVFTEYQATWSDNTADLTGGGSLKTKITTNAINFGVSYSF